MLFGFSPDLTFFEGGEEVEDFSGGEEDFLGDEKDLPVFALTGGELTGDLAGDLEAALARAGGLGEPLLSDLTELASFTCPSAVAVDLTI